MKRIGSPIVFVSLVAACGSSSSKTPDAATHIDAPADSTVASDALDAAPDAPVAAGNHTHYVIDRIIWPTNSTEARADALDLNNDGTVDNQLGMTFASFSSQGFDIQTPTDTSLARGGSITLADLQATSLTAATDAGFTLYAGTNPNPMPCTGSNDTVCGHHLAGTGSFDVAAMPRDTPIIGAITSGQYVGGPGHLSIPLYALTATPSIVTLIGARAKLSPSANGIMQGVIGGAITSNDLDMKVYPAMQQGMTAIVARDCTNLQNPPNCGCAQNSSGASVIGLFDANHDCSITVTEIKNNQLIMALFAPDVTVEGQHALSIGFAFTAVDATFTP